MDKEIIRQANPWPQTFVLTRREKEILYWWSRWGGKTDAWLSRLLRWIDNPKLRALVLRETYDDLVDWIDRAMQLYWQYWAVKSWLPVKIVFPSWAEIRTWYLKGQSYDKYKWHEYQKIIIEELTQIPWEDSYEKLLWSCRSTVDWLDPQIFNTTNPDGIGRLRVKRRFVDVWEPNKTFTDPKWNTRIFVPARLNDNPVLMEKDPWYIKYLEWITDEQLRRAWLEWDWDAYDIKWAIYSFQINQARKQNRICRIPYEPNIDVYTAWDLWISDYTAITFYQVVGKEVRVIDSYYNNGEDITHYAKVLRDKGYNYKRHFFPHDADKKSLWDWKTLLDHAISAWIEPITVLPRTSDVWADITTVRMKFPMIWIDSEKCKTLVEHLEIYRQERSEKLQIFKNEPIHWPESHFADSFRYLCISLDKVIVPIREDKPERQKINSLTWQPMNQTFKSKWWSKDRRN